VSLANLDQKGENLGVVYTPIAAAAAITEYVLAKLGSLPVAVLEPSAGDGSFLKALLSKRVTAKAVTAIDVSAATTDALSLAYPDTTVVCSDFLTYALNGREDKFDLIIGNPPFIRSRFFSPSFAENVVTLADQHEYARGELKNAWAAFVVAASSLLSCNGAMVFIVPYELLNVCYGKYLQSKLLAKFRFLEILVPNEKAFMGIEQDAVVIIASNSQLLPRHQSIKLVSSLEKPNTGEARELKLDGTKNQSVELKSSLLDFATSELLHRLRAEAKTVGDFCTSKAGIVTAANDFFILTEEEVEIRGLRPWARPILKKGSYLSHDLVYDSTQHAVTAARHKCLLIDFGSDGQPPLSQAAFDYLELGKEQGLDKRFKMKSREPWYRIPIVNASEGLFFKRSHRLPRLVPNLAEILATDTAYVVTAKDGFDMQSIAYSFYNILTILFAEIDGRFYGGGVLELTPSEFRNLPMAYFQPEAEKNNLFKLRFKSTLSNPAQLLHYNDQWLKTTLRISQIELEMLYGAYQKIQMHRLRHGSKRDLA
jgi:adenine-specific DNA-methyltransferase